ncbi:MAG TPA: RNA polymerase sigma factor [Ktedonosporobacter sp.]|nr:RNA polymerase sigma factor [Ktedonosporobacter sp.]
MVYQTRDTIASDPAPPSSLNALVTEAQQGSQSAFEALYARYNDAICRYLSRMAGNDGAGCELTQEAFLKAWSALPELRSPEHFVGWLYRIASNCAHDYQRRMKHIHTVSLDTCATDTHGLSIEGPEEGVGEAELLKLALARVSSTYRGCLILYVIEELPQRQIAERLHIKEASVSKYVSRGKEELRQIYQQLLKEQSSKITQQKRRGR